MLPTRIGRYEIIEEIGRGAVGTVFRAFDPTLRRQVAVKALTFEARRSSEVVARFQREAHAAAKLTHPNVVTIYDFGDDAAGLYLAMELLEGPDLRAAMTSGRLTTLEDKLSVVEQICAGLAFGHSRGVIHRDLKPANIHVQPDGLVKIVDFGLARLADANTSTTGVGMILGTPNYMSPEQVRGEKADPRSDIFSVGAITYELLTSRKPFESESLPAVFFNVLNQAPEPIAKAVPQVPEALTLIVERALQKNPRQRFQTAQEMKAALAAVQESLRPLVSPTRDETLSISSPAYLQSTAAGAGADGRPVPLRPEPERKASEPSFMLSVADLLALVESGQELAGELSLAALLQRILKRATDLTESRGSSVILQDERRDVLYFAHAIGPEAESLLQRWGKQSGQGIPIKGSKAGQVFSTGQSLIADAIPEDPEHFKEVDLETNQATTSMVCVPLSVMGKRIGVVQLVNKKSGNYTRRDVVLLEHFAGQAAVAIRNATLLNDLMAHMGFYADQTGDRGLGPVEVLTEISRPARHEELSVLFAGMRGFTHLCLVIGQPQHIQELLNGFVGMLAEAVIQHNGVVNKFHGDGLVGLFRGSRHAARAVETAADISQRFDKIRSQWDETINADLGFLDVGMGVATDSVILGSVGSERVRSFTAVGMGVNLASYLMEAARNGRRILVDKKTFKAARDAITEYEGPEPFVLKKPGASIGLPYDRYCVRSVRGVGVTPITGERPEHHGHVFISYSHRDKAWLQQLQAHLQPLTKAGWIRTWDDSKIKAGEQWREEVRRALDDARVAVLLVSPNFLNSSFIASDELRPLLAAAKQKGLPILWIPLTACLVDETEIGEYQALLDPARPLDLMSEPEQNQALVKVCRAIKAAATAAAPLSS